MANKNLFKSGGTNNRVAPVADTVNNAGGKAYQMSDKHALAQIAATNCFRGTFYASAEDNLKLAKEAAMKLRGDPEFIAKVALYSRDKGYMKDMPAFLTVMLADTDTVLFRKVFRRVIDNGKMLRNVFQMARSGAVTGRVFNMSSGAMRHAVHEWFNSRSPAAIFRASVGNNPTMEQMIQMCRWTPNSPEKYALRRYLLNKEAEFDALPQIVQEYEKFKATREGEVPNVDFRMLDSLGLSAAEWKGIARNAKWMMTRMNVNTFARQGVFEDPEMVDMISTRLRSETEIAQARALPYQLLSAWKATSEGIPFKVRDALQDAMEVSVNNVPEIEGQVYLCVDMSGSMGSPITGTGGWGGAKASEVSCADVAGLIASALVRKNRSAEVWTFDTNAKKVDLNPRDTVLTNTQILSRAGGGTSVSAPLAELNRRGAKGKAVIYVSDYESWVDSNYSWGGGTAVMSEWQQFQRRNSDARLVCIDLTPRANSQVKEHKNILQVGGFSDQVFEVLASFIQHGSDSANHWVSEIERVSIDE